jgi:hypothetical protein
MISGLSPEAGEGTALPVRSGFPPEQAAAKRGAKVRMAAMDSLRVVIGSDEYYFTGALG